MSRPRKPKDFWDDKEATPEDIKRGKANRQQVLTDLIQHALSIGPLDVSRVAQWHTGCFSGLSYVDRNDECLLGAYRGTSHPRLKNMIVAVGGIAGAPPNKVNEELARFFGELQKQMNGLAVKIKLDQDKSEQGLRQISEVAGWAHGEWVRIHPFANGSGRTARLIANWVLSRFRLLPIVGIRPRPEHPYGPAAVASMRGDHSKITQFIVDLLGDPPIAGK